MTPFDLTKTYPFNNTTWRSVEAVYVIMNAKSQIIYVGQTEDLKRRMDEHRSDKNHAMHRYSPALVAVEQIATEATRRARETELVAAWSPPANK